jgi:hypothetical protein
MWINHTHANLRVIDERHEHLRTLRDRGRLRRARNRSDMTADLSPPRVRPPAPTDP